MRSDARSAITSRLAAGVSSAAEISRAFGISQPVLSRAMRALEREQIVVRMGTTRGARYALRRVVDTIGSRWPIYRIDEDGGPRELGALYALAQDRYYASAGPPRIAGLFEGVPYYLQDARPAGFLGRAIPFAYPELALPARVIDWTDEHFLKYLARRGSDTSGNLIVGDESLDRFLGGLDGPRIVDARDRAAAYPALATAALSGAAPGSSAQGEWPKFTACIVDGERRTHMIVKFSAPRSTSSGERWADLLVSEHLAHRILDEHGVPGCRSSLLEAGDRVFLECERFDRIGATGRRGVVSLFALDAARYGRLDSWTAAAERLTSDALLHADDARRIRFLDAFGALIANTDRHFANVTLFDHHEGRLALAPVYDMLPMLFAPVDDQVIERQYRPAAPSAAWLPVWPEAWALASAYWDRLAREPRLSAGFRRLSSRCLQALQAAPHGRGG